MQAKLPDINAAIVRYRNDWLHAYSNKEYDIVIVAIDAVNALLPEDYKVEINSKKRNELVQENKIIVCSCGEVAQWNQVEFQTVRLPAGEQFLLGRLNDKVWTCQKCNKENIFDSTKRKTIKYQEPFYTGIIPEAPTRRFGISNRLTYEREFKDWYRIAIKEIESKIGKYRADYIAQMEGDDIDIPDEEHEKE